jgi:hypothetical protein
MAQHYTIVISLAGLFGLASIYAVVLAQRAVRAWYQRKGWTWVMLVMGVMLVIFTMGWLVLEGLADQFTWGLFVVAFAVAGVPIAVGEMLHHARQAGLNDARGDNGHEETRW